MSERGNTSIVGTVFFLIALFGGIAGFIYWNWYQALPEMAEERVQNLLDMRAPQKALEVAESALKVRPDNAELIVQRAEALQQLHRHEEAIKEFQRVAELDNAYVTRARLGIDHSWRVLNRANEQVAPQNPANQRDFAKELEEAKKRMRKK